MTNLVESAATTGSGSQTSQAVGWPTVVILVSTAAALVVMVDLSWGRESTYDTVAYGIQALALVVAGVLVVRRVPGHRIGVILVVMGVAATVTEVTEGWAAHATHPVVDVLHAISNCGWLVGAAGYALIALLYPTGQVPGRRWRVVIPILLVGWGLAVVGTVLGTAGGGEFANGVNPYARATGVTDTMWSVGTSLITVTLLAAIGSLVNRYRRGGTRERQQIRPFAYTLAALAVVAPLAVTMHDESAGVRVAIAVVVTAIPCSVCVSILRYRLYDVDRAAQAALVYGAVTLVLAVAFAATTLFIGTAIGHTSAWATAGATLLVAATFRPLRTWVQDTVDRRFRRAHHDALESAKRFMEDLRLGRAKPEGTGDFLRSLLGDPALVLLLRSTGAEGWVDEEARSVDEPAESPNTVLVASGGLVVGAIVLGPIDSGRRGLVEPVVAAMLLAVEMARLRMDLRLQLAALEGSRQRIDAAAEDERRRIERDLHDGAQQRLVSVGLVLRHAQHQIASDAGDPASTIDDAVEEVLAVIAELREMASGMSPSRLEHGLEAALVDLAERARPAPVVIDLASPMGRLPRSLETAAYFVACEALTNAIKHAGASKVVFARQPGQRGAPAPRPRRRRRWSGSLARNRSARARRSSAGVRGHVPPRQPRRKGHDNRGGVPMRVVIAEDQLLLREGLSRLFVDAGHEVDGAFGDMSDVPAAVRDRRPDLVIADVRMPPTFTDEGLRLARWCKNEHPEVGVLVLSQHIETASSLDLVGLAGFGYLLKDRVLAIDDFLAAAQRVADGGSALDPQVVGRLVAVQPHRRPHCDIECSRARSVEPVGRRPDQRGRRPQARLE